ncbi:transglutaminase domain-containing protein [Clostridium sp. OS1-26]|uniref:transglutaminase domain-containing protein n=1 Tax=Clostridium sp. OS1-26 TaxID=3070681 RepID=UPI0027E0A2D2|nr:transglutaminase domain-containing protein [Clostridium sp. OS1-26]WML36779.1 transglutaminase domain-containing protein [Clostridium sp. OS1-26]
MNKKNGIKKFGIVKIQFLAILMLLLFYSTTGHAQEAYKVFPAVQNVTTDKVWNVKFSQELDPATITDKNVRVLDESGNAVKVNLSCAGSTVTIKPPNNYGEGKKYTVLIDNVKSKKGSLIKSPLKMDFTTKENVQTNNEVGVGSYSLTDTHKYKITDTFTVTAKANTKLELNYNIGTDSNSPYQKELNLQVLGPDAKITSKDSIHKQLTVNTNIKAGDKIQYQVIRTVENSGIKYIKDLSKTLGNYKNYSDYNKYTSPSDKIESDNKEIISKAEELFKNTPNPYYKSKTAYEFVNTYMAYDVNSGNKGALNALNTAKGVCEDYAELYVALLRASKVPARVTTGFWVDTNAFNSSKVVDGNASSHAWVEYYLPEYGWIPAEPTNIYYRNGQQTIDFDFFSNLSSSGHIVTGYDPTGDFRDSNLSYSFSQGSGVYVDKKTTIEKLN